MDLHPSAQRAIIQIIGSDCFKNIEFSENIHLSTRFTLLVDSLTEYEYTFQHTIDRSEKSLYRRIDQETQTDKLVTVDNQIQTNIGEVSKVDEVPFDSVEVKIEVEDDESANQDVTVVTPEAPAVPEAQKQTLNNKPEDVSCPLCPAKFRGKESAERHLKTKHDIGNFYVCSICQHICNSKGALEDHISSDHSEDVQKETITKKRGRPRKTEPKKLLEVSETVSEEKDKKIVLKIKKTSKPKNTKTKTKPSVKKPKKQTSVEEDYDADTDVEDADDVLEKELMPTSLKKSKVIKKDKVVRREKVISSPDKNCECIKCGKEYKSRRALRRHYASHHEQSGQEYQCETCGKSFSSKDSLYHHRRGVHQNLKIYKCPEPGCEATFNFNHSLRLHKLKHSGTRPHMCSQCGKTYLTAYHLKVHVMASHSAKSFSCSVCGKMFSYSTSLKMHEATHQKQERVSCDQCANTFVNLQALKYHIMSKHTEPGNFNCEECGKVCKTEFLLRAHKKRHSIDGTRFMCDICGRRFMYKSALEMHRAIHRDDKQYTCKICNKSFKTYPTLYSHQYVHKEDSPFCCVQCGKAFKTKERCKAHEKRHSGLKPFECNICHHCFPDNGGLSKHMRTVHCAVKKFVCDICGKATSRADNLRVHMKVHTKGGTVQTRKTKPSNQFEQKSSKLAYNLPSMIPQTFENDGNYDPKIIKPEYYPENSNDSVNPSQIPQHAAKDEYSSADVYQPNMPNFSTLDSSQLSGHSEDQTLPLNLHNAVSQNAPNNTYQTLGHMNSHNNTAESLPVPPSSVPTSSASITVMALQTPHLQAMYAYPYVYQAPPPSGGSNGYFQQ